MENKFVSLDLEMNQPSGKIIQIGAVIGVLQTGEILDKFRAYVSIDEALNPFIIQLTGITQKHLDDLGTPLIEAYKSLLAWIEPHRPLFTNVITWGGGDSIELKQQLRAEFDKIIIGKVFDWPFGRRWLDVKTLFQFRQFGLGEKPQAGLAKALTKCGLQFEGRKHDATDDAFNTFRIAHKLMLEKPL